jgi:hypothetical protein
MTPHQIGKNPSQIGKSCLRGVSFCRNFASTKETNPRAGRFLKSQNKEINKVLTL